MSDKVLVIGGGSWGTALARLLCNKGIDTTIYIRDKMQYHSMTENRVNEKYLPVIMLPMSLKYTNDLELGIRGRSNIVFAVPTYNFRKVLESVAPHINKDNVIINVAKGIENESLERLSEISYDLAPKVAFVTLSGPSHAEEVALDYPTTVTVASDNVLAAKSTQELFSTKSFRVYTNPDLIGVELGGALKNVIALGSGIADGLGYGDNTKAALMTRGITEMAKLGVKMGAKTETFFGMAGIGDLIVTCTSMHSRNRRAGILIGKGKTAQEATEEVGMVVEGIKTTKSAYELKMRNNVEMPITDMLYRVIYEGEKVNNIIDDLMTRRSKDETEGLIFG
ncbi:MAG: NAD(P)H-dependent glycerol-3-phosphate dehydrogenase [Tissierellia bacterium]|nr:NAD(P)H-dependent glycerol-3-phosphate dehydrogenase [Tissierellia bacterium]